MRKLTIDVVADDVVIGQVEYSESHFADWEAMSRDARQMVCERCAECKKLQLKVGTVCLLDVTE